MNLTRVSDGHLPDVFLVSDDGIGLHAFIAFGDRRRVPSFGGIRRRRYESPAEARREAERLARQMQRKLCAAGVGRGGAKTVVMDHDGLDRRAAYEALGRAIASLDRHYVCGPDVGTTEADLDVIRGVTANVNHPDNDPAATTARGVFLSCLTTVARLGEDAALEGARVVVEGLGAVGGRVARELVRAGARVEAYDVDGERTAEVAATLKITLIDDGVPPVERLCDLFVPCALGGVVTRTNVGRVGARAICGSANDQLESDDLASVLHECGVLWAPDFIVNAGAVVEGVIAHGRDRADVADEIAIALEAIAARLDGIFEAADGGACGPLFHALELAGEGWD